MFYDTVMTTNYIISRQYKILKTRGKRKLVKFTPCFGKNLLTVGLSSFLPRVHNIKISHHTENITSHHKT